MSTFADYNEVMITTDIVVIAHDIRSCHNVGSLLRTAEGLGVSKVYLTGYTPYPLAIHDHRLPHEAAKLHKHIQKTALGAENTQNWEQAELQPLLEELKAEGYALAALEQAIDSVRLPDFRPPPKLALLLGREVEGIAPSLLKQMDVLLEIPMFGQKESFNVVQAAAMAIYHCRFAEY
jgi:23S rRNA (guanosine2251-2'-O)-methyltransferase